MRVKLQDVVEAMDFGCMEAECYYDTKTGKVVTVFDGMVDGDKNPGLAGTIREEAAGSYIPLPQQYDINEYLMIEEFVYGLPEGKNQCLLERAIRGKGAFGRFRAELRELGLEEKWYRYREEACEKIAREWCGRHKIEIEE